MLALGGFPMVGIFCLGAAVVGAALVLSKVRDSAEFLERIANRTSARGWACGPRWSECCPGGRYLRRSIRTGSRNIRDTMKQ